LADDILLCDVDGRGVATVTLNRPEIHNALSVALIAELSRVFAQLDVDDTVRAVILTGAGKSFSAGADLNAMKEAATLGAEDNLAQAREAAEMFHALNTLRHPTVARVNGSAFAGGVGLIACCDVALAADDALFAVTEARVGLMPSTISPYLLAAMGPRYARRYWLTAERFDATEAVRVGLIHGIAPAGELDGLVAATVGDLLQGAPGAIAACKALAQALYGPVTEELRDRTARGIATIRASEEGREGLAAFLEKRRPNWQEGSPS
jgi:methylglutaconyl-CoA hydratase